MRANANFGVLVSWVSGVVGRPAFTIMILKVERLSYVDGRDLALNSIVLEEQKTQDSGGPEQAW